MVLMMEIIFTDSSGTTEAVARHVIYDRNGVVNTRAKRKVGDSSIVLDGSNDYLETPDSSDFSFVDDFTIECWINTPDASIASARFLSKDRAGNRQFDFQLTSGQLSFYMNDVDDNVFGRQSSILDPLSENTWYHVAMVYDKSAGTLKMFVDGVEDTGAATVGSDVVYNITNTTAWFEIGRGYGGSYYYEGYLDEIRISDSARYTGNFTPQTTEFTADSNTMFLLHSNWDWWVRCRQFRKL